MIDWLARKVGCVIDFRLPGDPADIPSHVFRARTAEYLAQYQAQFKTAVDTNRHKNTSQQPTGDLFAEYESVTRY